MRVLVCGGREFGKQPDDRQRLFSALDRAHAHKPITTLVHGDAPGADSTAAAWAREKGGIRILAFPADWQRHGRAAGHIRNQQMLDEGQPQGVIAFPGGRGTADMTRRARRADLPVWQPLA